ncbi:MAG TPA: DUF2510 domain-containing protein [Trebonia sp.]|nr:DUF2510 domain-containing protein [Trebonia sp.]
MDSPPSGWYPDPYGVPGLLRWWDGSTWTQHTHEGSATDFSNASGPATMLDARIGAAPGMQPTSVQPPVRPVEATMVQPAALQPQARSGEATMVVNPARGAAPGTAIEPYGGASPTRVQPPVPAAMDPTQTMRPAHGGPAQGGTASPSWQNADTQPGAGSWPNAGPRPGAGSWPNAGPASDYGTQVLPMDPAAWDDPGGPGGYDTRPGRHRDLRRRPLLLAGLLVGGTAAAVALIVVVVSSLGSSTPTAPTAEQTHAPATTAPPTTPAVQATTASPTATPTSSVSALPTGVTDSVSGLSYSLLSSPWASGCPGGLSSPQTLTWTAGESAAAGQFTSNGQPATWYGEACSGPLTQQYGYSGVSDLETVTTNLVNQFDGPYYGALDHQRTALASTPVSVSGHPGWEVKYLETYPSAASMGLPFNSEEAAVVVVDQGNGGPPAVFFTSVPSNLGVSWVDSFVSSLALTPTAAATPTAPPTAPQPGGDGGNGGNNP